MQILYLHQYFNTPEMAGSSRSYQMARRLIDYGHEVTMITSARQVDDQSGNWFRTDENGIKVHWLLLPYSNKMSYRERMGAFLKFAWRASQKAANIKCDVIFASSTPLTIALPAVYAKIKLKVPMVFEVRDLWPELPIAVGALQNPLAKVAARRLERFAYKNSKHIVALSPGMKEGIVKTGYPEEQVSIIPNGCDLEFFEVDQVASKKLREKYHWLQGRPLVIYAGTIGIINGVDYLAHLARAVRDLDREIRFLVIGDGIGEKKFKDEAEKLGVLNDNLFMLPRLPKKDIPEWLGAADLAASLFIDLKEMWSNSANKFFDALAAGKPVAINYGGWQADLINDTGSGLVMDPRDIERSANLVAEKVRDRQWLGMAGSAAGKLARERFDRGILAKELESVLLNSFGYNQ